MECILQLLPKQILRLTLSSSVDTFNKWKGIRIKTAAIGKPTHPWQMENTQIIHVSDFFLRLPSQPTGSIFRTQFQRLVFMSKVNITKKDWGSNLQQMLDSDVQNPQNGTFTKPWFVMENHHFFLRQIIEEFWAIFQPAISNHR